MFPSNTTSFPFYNCTLLISILGWKSWRSKVYTHTDVDITEEDRTYLVRCSEGIRILNLHTNSSRSVISWAYGRIPPGVPRLEPDAFDVRIITGIVPLRGRWRCGYHLTGYGGRGTGWVRSVKKRAQGQEQREDCGKIANRVTMGRLWVRKVVLPPAKENTRRHI